MEMVFNCMEADLSMGGNVRSRDSVRGLLSYVCRGGVGVFPIGTNVQQLNRL